MIYYKAVRPDGTDFHSGTVDYASICGTGEFLPELPGGVCCTAGVYHASTSKADTLIGGKWPCRLFEVDGEAVSEEGNKRGFRTLQVVRELPAWEALGPNGEAVVRMVKQAKTLTADQVEQLDAAWYAAGYAAGYAASRAAQHAAKNAARYAAGNAAGHAARYAAGDAAWYAAGDSAWYAAGHAARYAAGDAAWYAAGDAARHAARYAMRYAARYTAGDIAGTAAGALVVHDLITEEQFQALAGPWISVMGDPRGA